MIRKYPAGNQELDHRISAKRDGEVKLGEFGAIVYIYKLALESRGIETNPEPIRSQGKLYHPVDTVEEAIYWLGFYKEKTIARGYSAKPLYEDAWFIPRGE